MPAHISKKKSDEYRDLPLIECCCGAKILLIPNVKLMSKAIEDHVLLHIKEIKSEKEAEAEAERVRDDLTAKVLIRASEL
ncbi:MAG: hypothetical protein NWE93_10555 [Candidatus Bathyarchaeota archaeon]|nr:hypothetical protein [Candidatus Bathyarchaeota archaeon]